MLWNITLRKLQVIAHCRTELQFMDALFWYKTVEFISPFYSLILRSTYSFIFPPLFISFCLSLFYIRQFHNQVVIPILSYHQRLHLHYRPWWPQSLVCLFPSTPLLCLKSFKQLKNFLSVGFSGRRTPLIFPPTILSLINHVRFYLYKVLAIVNRRRNVFKGNAFGASPVPMWSLSQLKFLLR